VNAVPRLETERLTLRDWRLEDFESYTAIFCDPEVTQFISKAPTRNEAWRQMAAQIGHWSLRGYGAWAVERKSDGAVIGRIGFWFPDSWPACELIWTLGRAYWGHGYASEGAKAAMAFGFTELAFPKIVSHIDPKNHRSERVAKRLGQEPEGTVELPVGIERFRVVSWEIPRARWETIIRPA
jgi:RimJ/RimL family protein N-acetyltransferase